MEVFPKRKPHLEPLTSIRFVAAFHVVLYHGSQFVEPALGAALGDGIGMGLARNLVHTGYTGVNLFFLLSGFILAYTYLDPDAAPSVDARRFWVARIARIYPLYVLSLVLVAPMVVSHFLDTNDLATAVLKISVSCGAALALIQAWIPPLRPIWNFPGWTLSVEAFFYLCFPFVVPWIWRLGARAALAAGAAIWCVGLLPAVASLWILPPAVASTPATGSLSGGLAALITGAPLLRLHEFVLGIALARAFFPGSREWSARTLEIAMPALALVSAAAVLVLIAGAHHVPRVLVHAGLFDPVYGALIVSLAHCRGWLRRALSLRPCVVLGEVSYGVYVLHIPVLVWLVTLVGVGTATDLGIGFFALWSGVLVAASTASYFWFEEPVRVWIRARFGSGARARARAAATAPVAYDEARRDPR